MSWGTVKKIKDGCHLISSHLTSQSWHCLSMAISSRLALWEQKESSTQGSGRSLRGQPDDMLCSISRGAPRAS